MYISYLHHIHIHIHICMIIYIPYIYIPYIYIYIHTHTFLLLLANISLKFTSIESPRPSGSRAASMSPKPLELYSMNDGAHWIHEKKSVDRWFFRGKGPIFSATKMTCHFFEGWVKMNRMCFLPKDGLKDRLNFAWGHVTTIAPISFFSGMIWSFLKMVVL